MRRSLLRVLWVAVFLLGCSTPCFALTVLKGGEAAAYLGDAKTHFLSAKYTYEILTRKHRDAMHGRFSDAVIFNKDGGNFLYPRRKDGDHIVVIDAPGGREEDPATEDVWRQKLANTLSDDNNTPYVFLDGKNELATVFVGNRTEVTAKMNSDNLLEITIAVEGARDAQKTFRRRH